MNIPGSRPAAALLVTAILAAAPLDAGDPAAAAAEEGGASALAAFSPVLPSLGLYSSGAGNVPFVAGRPRVNMDVTGGPYFPIDGGEDFDVGGTFDMRIQGEVMPYFFVGGEFAYIGHGKHAGDLYSDGFLHRFCFLIPIEADIPLAGQPENPMSLRLGVAPGMMVVDPVVDHDLEDTLYWNGYDLDEETFVAFDLRFRIGFRLPLDPHSSFLFEGGYDWCEGEGTAELHDLYTGETDRQHRRVNLSGVSLFLGFAFVF